MIGHRTRERVLGVGVDVHLHHAVADRVRDLAGQRTGTSVEDEEQRLGAFGQATLLADRGLAFLEDFRTQLDVAWLVHTVHVAEGQRRHVRAVLTDAEGLDGGQGVFGGGVELVVDLADDTVFFTADDTDLDLEDCLLYTSDAADE